ncbi:MAG: phenylalanine--tRNA ligase subunit beta [Bacteroidetes bacterium]|nr:phenylalanine--tRNA ligase subunit beta [Bacteroidota bacterium]
MKISYNWLKSIININLPALDIANTLTSIGLEVEAIENFESIKGGLKGLVVGQIITCQKHPDADKLKLTTVNIGSSDLLNIVCGAPNVSEGQKVIVATIGTKLFFSNGDEIEIKKSKIRGQLSEGMICAEDEIGLGSSHAGIMVLPQDTAIGTLASNYFKVETDTIFEIGLTPNRSDAASHLGVARDLAAYYNSKSNDFLYEIITDGLKALPEASNISTVKINIQNTDACARYSGMVISGIEVTQSPDWLKNRLKSIGLRPINNIVDVTNFIMHSIGQPMHAFDLDKITGHEINVRYAHENETLTTLDGIERKLKTNDLIIANAKNPMCLAGVFGGIDSGVSENTKSIFLESAFFDAGVVRKSSKQHSLKTDSSFRFERGTDPNQTINALIKAANLILEIAGGSISMGITDIYPEKIEAFKVAFSIKNCCDVIGKEIESDDIKKIIKHLGIAIESESNDAMLLQVPRFKTDVTREADVIEEVLRIYGFENIPTAKKINYSYAYEKTNTALELQTKISSILQSVGFNEMMGLSLTKSDYIVDKTQLVHVLNPLSNDLNIMRNSLLHGGLEAVAHNLNRKQSNLKLFEFGNVYSIENGKYTEQKKLLLLVTGTVFSENHYKLNQTADIYYLKSMLKFLIDKTCNAQLMQAEDNTMQINKQKLGMLLQVENSVLKQFGINQPVCLIEIDFDTWHKESVKQKIEFQELNKFPIVKRDLALLIDKKITYSQIEKLAFESERKLLKEVNLFDVYESEKLGSKKSYAVSFTLENREQTLTDKQIDAVMEKLIKNYKEKLNAELR